MKFIPIKTKINAVPEKLLRPGVRETRDSCFDWLRRHFFHQSDCSELVEMALRRGKTCRRTAVRIPVHCLREKVKRKRQNFNYHFI